MTSDDLFTGQATALCKVYNGLPKGLKGTVQGYRARDNKVLVRLENKSNTEEYIPMNYLLFVLWKDK